MQQGFMSQGGMVSIFQDFPMSPDMVSEIKVLTSNYAPEYGSSTVGQIMAVTKSGGSSFHGAGFELPPRRLAAAPTQWGASKKPAVQEEQLRRQHRRPGQDSRPLQRQSGRATSTSTTRATGRRAASNQPTLSIPSLAERNGDFRDWRDAPRQPDPDLRPVDYSDRTATAAYIKISSWAATATTPAT